MGRFMAGSWKLTGLGDTIPYSENGDGRVC